MADRNASTAAPVWLGPNDSQDTAVGAAEPFGGGEMWVGECAIDGDVLVFDPSQATSARDLLSFYSMTQLRTRVFPRSLAERQIRELSDEARTTKAKADYARRDELRAVREAELATARAELSGRQREQVIQRHERYLGAHDIPYQGVRDTPADRKPGRRVKCHSCGIALDDFAGSLCNVCSEVLCSCGACACPRRAKGS
jgi:hypothetical protein